MNINALRDDNIYTLNALTEVLGCNRKTTLNYVTKKDFPITTININNRDYTAYLLTKEDIAKIDYEINNNKKNQSHINAKSKTIVNRAFNSDTSDNVKTIKNEAITEKQSVLHDYTSEMLRNVKQDNKEIIELVNAKNNLQNKNIELEKKLNEVKMQNAQLESTKLILEQKVLMIEDKKGFLEGEYSKLSQEMTKLNKSLKIRNSVILTLSAILLIIATIFITLNVIVK